MDTKPTRKGKSKTTSQDHEVLTNELKWLQDVLSYRLKSQFGKEKATHSIKDFPAPKLDAGPSRYANFVLQHRLSSEERLVFILALAPHLLPELLDQTIESVIRTAGEFPQLGGIKGESYRGFIPTGETAIFLLSDNTLSSRFQQLRLLTEQSVLFKERIASLDLVKSGEPLLSGKLVTDAEYVEIFTLGKVSKPKMSTTFPAQAIETALDWDDLILSDRTMDQIRELETWINHHETLLSDWGMNKHLGPGYRTLFHGPPGTGKTMTASLIGKYTDKDVFRVDLSLVVSKYIGETEKNLSGLFDKAQNKGWILFFDEADALFGKRTNVRDAHDKYANQEVSYLLQRIESYAGLVILATNIKSNIDEAFLRRFDSVIEFHMPNPDERFLIWRKAFPEIVRLEPKIDLEEIAKKFELSGSNIMNIVQFSCLNALEKSSKTIKLDYLIAGIDREYRKEGKII